MTADDRIASTLTEIRERGYRNGATGAECARLSDSAAVDVPRILAAVEAALEQADDLTRKSEALDAEAEYIAGEHPEAAAVAVLKRERSIAYDECARWFREAITREITGPHPSPQQRGGGDSGA